MAINHQRWMCYIPYEASAIRIDTQNSQISSIWILEIDEDGVPKCTEITKLGTDGYQIQDGTNKHMMIQNRTVESLDSNLCAFDLSPFEDELKRTMKTDLQFP